MFERHAKTRWVPRTVTYKDENGEWKTTGTEFVEYEPEMGIMTWWLDYTRPGVFFLGKVVGNGKHWKKRVHELANQYGCDTIESHTYRNPETWTRKYGGHIKGYIMETTVAGFCDEDYVLG